MIETFFDNTKQSLNRWFRKFGIKVQRTKPSLRYNPGSFTKERKNEITKTVLTNKGNSVFFGYHDKTPFSSDNRRVLANSVQASPTVLENECSTMELGYYQRKEEGTFSDSRFIKFAESNTWSWQQGCMLQWNPTRPNDQVFFNTTVNDSHGSVLFDIDKEKIIREYDRPVYSISPKADIASSINFRRVAEFRPGYGYQKFSEQDYFENVPDNDGISLIDLNSGDSELILNIKELADYSNHEVPHYINHVRFSPEGGKILFFHIIEPSGDRRVISFYLYDIHQKKLELLEASRNVSHFCWRNENEIFTSEIGGGKSGYFLYDLIKKTKQKVTLTDIGDTHPMFSPTDADTVLLDTKPDVNRDQHLFTFNLNSESLEHLGKFTLPAEFKNAVRCDLHPRWSADGNLISVDTVDDNVRSMTILQLN